MRWGNRGERLFRAETLMIGLVACSLVAALPARADDDDDDSGSWSDKIGDSIKHSMDGAKKAVGLGTKADAPPPAEAPSGCPTIAILEGTNAQRVTVSGAEGNQGVRYQYSLADVGRQCTAAGGRVSIKVSADGRVLLGPAGSAGRFDVPIRVVVFSELQQKPVASKLYRVPASIGGGQTMTPFQFVSDDIVVPLSGDAAREYSIKVGIDAGKGGGDIGVAKKPRHHRQKAQDSASN